MYEAHTLNLPITSHLYQDDHGRLCGQMPNMASNHSIADAIASDKSMPIAVVGVSCRFPGEATNPQSFWDMITEGRDAWSPIPKDRFNADAWWHPNGERQGSVRYFNFPVRGILLLNV